MNEIGEFISHYRILARIGAGGMGEVHLHCDRPKLVRGDQE